MGARAQVKIEDTGIYLYTHWGSQELARDVQTGLRRADTDGRLSDEEYLTRIIFDAMKGDDITGTTGYGISNYAHDDLDFEPIVINCDSGTVTYNDIVYTFQEFIDADFSDKDE